MELNKGQRTSMMNNDDSHDNPRGGREVTYNTTLFGLLPGTKKIRNVEESASRETKKSKGMHWPKWGSSFLNQLAACIQPNTNHVNDDIEITVPANVRVGMVPVAEDDAEGSDDEFYDAVESEDDDEVAERTRKIHEDMRKVGLKVDNVSHGILWWNSKLVRKQSEVYMNDFIGTMVVRLSPLANTLQPYSAIIQINKDFAPDVMNFESDFFKGRVCFRCSPAVALGAPKTDYFNGRKRLFSMQVQGKFKVLPKDPLDLVGGARFGKRFDLPFYAPRVLDFVRQRDKSLVISLDQDPPQAAGPQMQTAMRFNETDLVDGEIPAWRWGGDVVLLEYGAKDEKESSKIADSRRLNYDQWLAVTAWDGFKMNKCYDFDNFNSYVDFTTMSLSLGSFLKISVAKLLEYQGVSLMAFDRTTNTCYWGLEIAWKQGISSPILPGGKQENK